MVGEYRCSDQFAGRVLDTDGMDGIVAHIHFYRVGVQRNLAIGHIARTIHARVVTPDEQHRVGGRELHLVVKVDLLTHNARAGRGRGHTLAAEPATTRGADDCVTHGRVGTPGYTRVGDSLSQQCIRLL